ncbi:MAG: hypothetical protein CML61_11125 [Rhodobacteraceae bacterium]|nr:hypothetical protein [Paracoccaceae bacterium]
MIGPRTPPFQHLATFPGEEFIATPPIAVLRALAAERQHRPAGMRRIWRAALLRHPQDVTACRMTLRWYRRDRRMAEGRALLSRLYPDANENPASALMMLHGLAELHAEAELDSIVTGCLSRNPRAPGLRNAYVHHLHARARYVSALRVLRGIPAEQVQFDPAFLQDLGRKAALLSTLTPDPEADAVPHVIRALARLCPPFPADGAKARVSFLSGTLGPGGAERQMTRIACGLFGDRPVDVILRRADPGGEADFFAPDLIRAGVPIYRLGELPATALLPRRVSQLVDLLPQTLRAEALRLAGHYRHTRPAAVYLWQDGAVLTGALGALLAGVPRIVTSFRGMPPIQRPELLRPHMASAFPILARLNRVRLTANSTPGARAYEDWLGLRRGAVAIIHNAAPPVAPTSPKAPTYWRGIHRASPACHITVLGIFRHDRNKRARDWIEVAARLLRHRDDVRFVVLGQGSDHARNLQRVRDLGLASRIFLPGLCRDVPAALARSDLLMHLPRLEGSPNALIEAQAAGVPVLCTPAGNAAQIVGHGETGHLLPRADRLDIGETAAILATLLADPHRLTRMGEAGRRRCRALFGLDTSLARTRAVLDGFQMTTRRMPSP